MKVNNELINKLSRLSSLKIDDDKIESIKRELEDIVNFVEVLNDVDTEDTKEYFSNSNAILREDVACSNAKISKDILDNSPQNDDGYFVVPKIIE